VVYANESRIGLENRMPRRRQPDSSNNDTAHHNIRTIVNLEKKALQERSVGERFSDVLVRVAGRMWFTSLHVVWFGSWIVINSGFISGVPSFDPYPFQFLTLVVSLEAIFLSLFILMSHNRANRQSEQRAHLDLQINLLAELETTKMLQLLQALCAHHHLPQAEDPELKHLVQRTKPGVLAKELQSNMPDP
jgi:uncharacterized membrane protein